QDVRATVVADGVHGIEAQSVDTELLDPVERVVDEEVAHDSRPRPIDIDPGAPQGLMPVREELRRVEMEIVPFRPEVIVDDIDKHHETLDVGGLDQRLQLFRPTVLDPGPKRLDAVIAPVVSARRFRQGHQLDRGDTDLDQVVELASNAAIGAVGREGADMKLIEHSLLPWPSAPAAVAPCEGRRVD